jgi:hypothetical protein
MSRLRPYNKPVINVVIGGLASIIQGAISPLFGGILAKILFALFITWDKKELRHESN